MPGSSHDRVVATSRFALPVLIGVLAAFLVTAPLTMSGEVSFLLDKNKVEVAKERLRLQSAVYRGQDDRSRPFVLRAGSAAQKSSAEPIVQLSELAAEIALADGPAQFDADAGRYDIDQQRLMVDGPLSFRTTDGYNLETSNAIFDMKSRQLRSGGLVTGRVPQGSFSAAHLRADLETHIVVLSGNARLRIVPRRAK